MKAARKARRLAEAAAAAEARGPHEVGIDPDLIGIRPGPQPIPDDPLDRRAELGLLDEPVERPPELG